MRSVATSTICFQRGRRNVPIYLDGPEQGLHTSEGAPRPSAVQSRQDAISAPGGDGFRELSAAEATKAFEQLFAGLSERIRNNEIVQAAHLVHGADGVLRAAPESPEKCGETLGEGGRR